MKNIAGAVVPRLTYSLDPALALPPALDPAVALDPALDPAVALDPALDPALAFDPCLRPWIRPWPWIWPLTHAEGDENVAIDRPYWYMKQIAERLRLALAMPRIRRTRVHRFEPKIPLAPAYS